MKEAFEIKILHSKNNFLYFNDTVLKKILSSKNLHPNKPIFKLSIENKHKGSFTLSPISHGLEDWEVGVNSVLVKALGLEAGQTATLTCVDTSVPEAKCVTVSPASEEDFEILELNSHNIQDNLLDQLQVVNSEQTFVVWPTPHLHIKLIVDCIEPRSELVLLSNTTELHVNPHPRSSRTQLDAQVETTVLPVWSGVQRMFRALVGGQELTKTDIKEEKTWNQVIFRVHPTTEATSNSSVIKIHTNFLPNFRFAKVEMIWNKKTDTKIAYIQIASTDIVPSMEPISKLPVAYLNQSSYADYNLDTGCKITLNAVTNPVEIEQMTIKISTETNLTVDEIKAQLIKIATDYDNVLLLNSGSQLQLADNVWATVELEREFGILSLSQIDKCNIKTVKGEPREEETREQDANDHASTLLDHVWGSLYGDALLNLQCNLISPLKCVMVIRGSTGSGKSSLCRLLQCRLVAAPSHVHWAAVDCRPLKGKQVENIRTCFLKFFQECVRLQPAVGVIENLEVFCPPPSLEQRETVDASYCLSIQELIWEIGTACSRLHNVVMIATTSNNDAFSWSHEIVPSEYYSMPELSIDDKCAVLSNYLNTSEISCSETLIKTIIKFTEGYRVQDIKDLSGRIIFNIWQRYNKGCEAIAQVEVLRSDAAAALTDFIPLGMHGVKLFSARAPPPDLQDEANDIKWANVGGLEDIKQNLTELIEWPSKYPHLFADAPLKLQLGVVLYGMPGTGKTLLAAELAKSSGANFISVKGPELLSKYIGASEQAVRDLFDKAHAAKPCILFFDEFDSLAPSRGRDTTGVSDRVVNQLLTSLDGVDSPTDSGVWVVAATSRPDLLDKALLRPGRLDTILHCSLPHKAERRDIVQILSRKLSLSDEVNLEQVAELTEGFTGADLQALMYTAQLAALEETLGELDFESCEVEASPYVSGVDKIVVTSGHVQHALATTRPSLSRAEVSRYNKIYSDFNKSRTPGESQHYIPTQRTTLA